MTFYEVVINKIDIPEEQGFFKKKSDTEEVYRQLIEGELDLRTVISAVNGGFAPIFLKKDTNER